MTSPNIEKTTAETEAKIQENVKKGLRLKENRDAIAEAGEKGYKGKKGDEAERLKAKDIADKIRESSTRKPAAAPAATSSLSVQQQADAILSGGN